MTIRYYISGHGLGHASRSCQIINTLFRLAPRMRVEIATDAAPWFLDSSLERELPRRPVRLDVGAVQKDSLRSGRWHEALEALLQQPPPQETIAADGDEVAARRLIRFYQEGC